MSGFSVVEKVRYVVTTPPVDGGGIPANAMTDSVGDVLTDSNGDILVDGS